MRTRRHHFGKLTLEEWQHKKAEWRKDVEAMKRESPGTTFCIHKYHTYNNCGVPTGLTADVIFPHGTARDWIGKTRWKICVKCGRIKLTYPDVGPY